MSAPEAAGHRTTDDPGSRPGGVRRRLRGFLSTAERRPFMVAWQAVALATLAVTVIGGVLVRITDPDSIDGLGEGMWWAVQTVTTVGYGDTLPQSPAGHLIAALVMMVGVAFLSITTAMIASLFSESTRRRIQRNREDPTHVEVERLHRRMDELLQEIRELRASVRDGRNPPAPGE